MSMFTDAISKLAPTIAAAMGGPLAGVATNFVLGKLGIEVDKSKSPEEQMQEVMGDNKNLVELKRLDLEFKKFLAEKQIKVQELENADRASAREREKIVKDRTPSTLAYIVTGGYFLIIGALLVFPEISKDLNKELTFLIIGSLIARFSTILDYYFGASKGQNDSNVMKFIKQGVGKWK